VENELENCKFKNLTFVLHTFHRVVLCCVVCDVYY
jgi:hypothetical protein